MRQGRGVSPASLGELLDLFEENFRSRGEIGASVSVWWRGEEVLSAGEGWCEKERLRKWTSGTVVPVYSATKGPAAATLLLALDSHGLGPETPVREVWPGFPLEEATFGELLSHQCGLAALDRRASLWDHAEVVAAIEAQVPAWRPGEGHGYHPRTFGALLEEPVRRLTGRTLGEEWRERIAALDDEPRARAVVELVVEGLFGPRGPELLAAAIAKDEGVDHAWVFRYEVDAAGL